jgi:hypothetical protein
MTKFARSDERSESSSNEVQNPNGQKVFDIQSFGIDLTFACLPVGRDFGI